MARGDACGDVGTQPAVVIGGDVVAGDDTVGLEGLPHLVQRVLLAGEDSGEVHHLAQGHDAVPAHALGHLAGVYGRTGVLDPQHGRYAGRGGEHGLERGARRVLPHGPHAFKSADVGDLMWVRVDAHGAVGDDGAGVLGRTDHRGLDVYVRVKEAGGRVESRGIHHGGLGSDAMLGRVSADADVGNTPAGDGYVRVLEDLACGDADEPGVADDRLRGLLALGDLG